MSTATRKYVLWAGYAVLGGVVAWGFTMAGSPAKVREMKQDRLALSSIVRLACYAERFFCKNKHYPESKAHVLEDVRQSKLYWCSVPGMNSYSADYNLLSDEQSITALQGEGYSYQFGNNAYTICTQLLHDSNEHMQDKKSFINHLPNEMREFKVGKQCFTFASRRQCEKEK